MNSVVVSWKIVPVKPTVPIVMDYAPIGIHVVTPIELRVGGKEVIEKRPTPLVLGVLVEPIVVTGRSILR